MNFRMILLACRWHLVSFLITMMYFILSFSQFISLYLNKFSKIVMDLFFIVPKLLNTWITILKKTKISKYIFKIKRYIKQWMKIFLYLCENEFYINNSVYFESSKSMFIIMVTVLIFWILNNNTGLIF